VLGTSVLATLSQSAAALPLLYAVDRSDAELRVLDTSTGLTFSSVTMTLSGEAITGANGSANNSVTGEL